MILYFEWNELIVCLVIYICTKLYAWVGLYIFYCRPPHERERLVSFCLDFIKIMLNLFSSSWSILCQFYFLKSPLFQVIFMKITSKFPYLKPYVIILNLESSLGAEKLSDYLLCATLFNSGIDFVLPPLRIHQNW